MDPVKMVEDIQFFMTTGQHYQRAEAILQDLQRWVTDTLKECRNAADNQ